MHETMESPGSSIGGTKNKRFDTTTKSTYDSVYEGENVNEIISHDESVAQLKIRSVPRLGGQRDESRYSIRCR